MELTTDFPWTDLPECVLKTVTVCIIAATLFVRALPNIATGTPCGHAQRRATSDSRTICPLVYPVIQHDWQPVLGRTCAIPRWFLKFAACRLAVVQHKQSLAAYISGAECWKDADPEIPILREAKAEYAKLQ